MLLKSIVLTSTHLPDTAMEEIAADYLVVGAGAMGLAFVDELVANDTKKTVVIIDRHDRVGGHWLTAYPFVRLHQPAAAYGVNSKILEHDGLETTGWNKGLADCSTRDDVCAYFDRALKDMVLTGRVRFFPRCEYDGKGVFRSILTGKTYHASEGTTLVDATYSRVEVPSMRPPPYDVRDVDIIPINGLSEISRGYAHYTVVGAGKTGVDACLYLLDRGIGSDHITWIMPRDAYYFSREAFQPTVEATKIFNASLVMSVMAASSAEDVVTQLIAHKGLHILHEEVRPTMFHCATISQLELQALKGIKSVVRKGRVTRITPSEVTLEQGSYSPTPDSLYIDCSAGAIPRLPAVPTFGLGSIVLQPIRMCQQTFSAAAIAHVEATFDDQALKNELCRPIPMPDEPLDFVSAFLKNNLNTLAWCKQPKTVDWLANCRLNMPSHGEFPRKLEWCQKTTPIQV